MNDFAAAVFARGGIITFTFVSYLVLLNCIDVHFCYTVGLHVISIIITIFLFIYLFIHRTIILL